MKKTSTINLFLKSLYEPISTEELTLIANSSQQEIQEQKELLETLRLLPNRKKTPSSTSIDIILNFSKEISSELDAIQ